MAAPSPAASQWSSLFDLYLVLGLTIGALVIGWLLFTAVRYRQGRTRKNPEDAPRQARVPPERGTAWVAILLALAVASVLFALTLGTVKTVDLIEHPPSPPALTVEVHAFQWGFRFLYPNGEERIGEVRVPRGEVIAFNVTSDDVFHTFGLPDFRVKTDAIPGRVNSIWIEADTEGTYVIRCYELCGDGHSWMTASLIVMDPEDFAAWYGG